MLYSKKKVFENYSEHIYYLSNTTQVYTHLIYCLFFINIFYQYILSLLREIKIMADVSMSNVSHLIMTRGWCVTADQLKQNIILR